MKGSTCIMVHCRKSRQFCHYRGNFANLPPVKWCMPLSADDTKTKQGFHWAYWNHHVIYCIICTYQFFIRMAKLPGSQLPWFSVLDLPSYLITNLNVFRNSVGGTSVPVHTKYTVQCVLIKRKPAQTCPFLWNLTSIWIILGIIC